MQPTLKGLLLSAVVILSGLLSVSADPQETTLYNGRQYHALSIPDWMTYGRPSDFYEIGDLADESHADICTSVLSELNKPYPIDRKGHFASKATDHFKSLSHKLALMMHTDFGVEWGSFTNAPGDVQDKISVDFNNDGVPDTIYRFNYSATVGVGSTLLVLPPEIAIKAEQSGLIFGYLWKTRKNQPQDPRLWRNDAPVFDLKVATPPTAPVKFRDLDRLIELINLNGHSYFLMAYSRHLDDNTPFNVYLFEPQTTHSHEYMCRFDARFIVGAFPPSEGVPAIYSTAAAEPTPR